MGRERNLRIWNEPSSTKITEFKERARRRLRLSPSISPNLKQKPKLDAGEAGCGALPGAGQSGPEDGTARAGCPVVVGAGLRGWGLAGLRGRRSHWPAPSDPRDEDVARFAPACGARCLLKKEISRTPAPPRDGDLSPGCTVSL